MLVLTWYNINCSMRWDFRYYLATEFIVLESTLKITNYRVKENFIVMTMIVRSTWHVVFATYQDTSIYVICRACTRVYSRTPCTVERNMHLKHLMDLVLCASLINIFDNYIQFGELWHNQRNILHRKVEGKE
jgi:hypothetical protein